MTGTASPPSEKSPAVLEPPLSPLQNGLYLLLASLLATGVCLYVLLVMLASVALIAAPFVFTYLKSDFSFLVIFSPALFLFGRTFQLLVEGFFRKGPGDYVVALSRDEAPDLWGLVEDMSRRLQVEAPEAIHLMHGVNASVALKGSRAGQGRSRIFLGFDLLAGLKPAHARAVLAHELAHAKYVH
ncbi:hypothetical protein EON80_19430, partial [bacterium]